MRSRFDVDLLDPEDPFEIDENNRPHLHKHLPNAAGRPIAIGEEDLLDVYLYADPNFEEALDEGAADWLMIGEVPGITLCVPLAPSRSRDHAKCRPIGIYTASAEQVGRYRAQTT